MKSQSLATSEKVTVLGHRDRREAARRFSRTITACHEPPATQPPPADSGVPLTRSDREPDFRPGLQTEVTVTAPSRGDVDGNGFAASWPRWRPPAQLTETVTARARTAVGPGRAGGWAASLAADLPVAMMIKYFPQKTLTRPGP